MEKLFAFVKVPESHDPSPYSELQVLISNTPDNCRIQVVKIKIEIHPLNQRVRHKSLILTLLSAGETDSITCLLEIEQFFIMQRFNW